VSLGIVEYRPGTGAATTALDHAISANPLYSLRKVSDLQEQHCLLGGGILFNSLESYQDRSGFDIAPIKVDPFLDPLRGDPRFEALVEKVFAPKNSAASSAERLS